MNKFWKTETENTKIKRVDHYQSLRVYKRQGMFWYKRIRSNFQKANAAGDTTNNNEDVN